LSTFTKRAYRGQMGPDELQRVMTFFEEGRRQGGFETGIQMAVWRVLASPQFLFRFEHDPPSARPGVPYRISDLELASRLSFFLWSTIPDDELLAVAERGELQDPAILERQVRRMLADPKASALVQNFASQWLSLQKLANIRPD